MGYAVALALTVMGNNTCNSSVIVPAVGAVPTRTYVCENEICCPKRYLI